MGPLQPFGPTGHALKHQIELRVRQVFAVASVRGFAVFLHASAAEDINVHFESTFQIDNGVENLVHDLVLRSVVVETNI